MKNDSVEQINDVRFLQLLCKMYKLRDTCSLLKNQILKTEKYGISTSVIYFEWTWTNTIKQAIWQKQNSYLFYPNYYNHEPFVVKTLILLIFFLLPFTL